MVVGVEWFVVSTRWLDVLTAVGFEVTPEQVTSKYGSGTRSKAQEKELISEPWILNLKYNDIRIKQKLHYNRWQIPGLADICLILPENQCVHQGNSGHDSSGSSCPSGRGGNHPRPHCWLQLERGNQAVC